MECNAMRLKTKRPVEDNQQKKHKEMAKNVLVGDAAHTKFTINW